MVSPISPTSSFVFVFSTIPYYSLYLFGPLQLNVAAHWVAKLPTSHTYSKSGNLMCAILQAWMKKLSKESCPRGCQKSRTFCWQKWQPNVQDFIRTMDAPQQGQYSNLYITKEKL
jgi:hypothetical protein